MVNTDEGEGNELETTMTASKSGRLPFFGSLIHGYWKISFIIRPTIVLLLKAWNQQSQYLLYLLVYVSIGFCCSLPTYTTYT